MKALIVVSSCIIAVVFCFPQGEHEIFVRADACTNNSDCANVCDSHHNGGTPQCISHHGSSVCHCTHDHTPGGHQTHCSSAQDCPDACHGHTGTPECLQHAAGHSVCHCNHQAKRLTCGDTHCEDHCPHGEHHVCNNNDQCVCQAHP